MAVLHFFLVNIYSILFGSWHNVKWPSGFINSVYHWIVGPLIMFFVINIYIHIFLFNYKARDNTNKKSQFIHVVWTRLTRGGCFDWLAHYKRKRIVNK